MMRHFIHRGRWLAIALLSWVAIGSSPAEAPELSPYDPQVGFRVLELVKKSPEGRAQKEALAMLEEAAEAYRRASFSVAMDWCESAAKLLPEAPPVAVLLEFAAERRALQREAQRGLPLTQTERQRYVETAYEQADRLLDDRQYEQAFAAFHQVWLIAGDYKKTLSSLEKALDKGRFDPEIALAGTLPDVGPSSAPAVATLPLTEAAPVEPPESQPVEEPAPEAAVSPEAIPPMEPTLPAAEPAAPPLAPAEARLRVDELTLQAQFEAQRGNSVVARGLYEQALSLDPENKVVLRGLRLLEAALEEAATAPSQPVAVASPEESPAEGGASATTPPLAEAEPRLPVSIGNVPPIDTAPPTPLVLAPALPTTDVPPVQAPRIEVLPAQELPAPEATLPAEQPQTLPFALPAAEPESPARPAVESALAPTPPRTLAVPIAEAAPAPAPTIAEPEPPRAEPAVPPKEGPDPRLQGLSYEAEAALRVGEWDRAEANYREILSFGGDDREALKGLQKAQEARAREDKARREAEIDRLTDAADAARRQGQWEAAQAALDEVLRLDPRHRRARRDLREVEERLEEARREETAAAVEADLKVARDLIEAGDLERARERLTIILGEAPGHEPAQRELRRIDQLVAQGATRAPAPAAVAPPVAVSAPTVAPGVPIAAAPAVEEPGPLPVTLPLPDASASARRGAVDVAQAAQDQPPAAALPAAASPEGARSERQARLERAQRLNELFERARRQYNGGDIVAARQTWEEMLRIDPTEKRAQVYLENTKAEFERFQADVEAQRAARERARAREELLNSPVTVITDRVLSLSEFMRQLSFSTITEIRYYIADGAETEIFASLTDMPLREVLDRVLTPKGLAWDIDANNLITIRTNLRSRTFNLTTDQMNKLRSLKDTGELQRVIWGQPEPPVRGAELTIDERQRILLVVGSQLHIEKITDFLDHLETAVSPELETRFYKIRPDDADRIRVLIDALITASQATPLDLERKLFIDGSDLIIRDTPENIVKIEELLLDQQFINNLRDERLELQNWSLIPRDVDTRQTDEIAAFTGRVVEAIRTFLYAREGVDAARREGRNLWFDPATLQLTVVDTPTNIERVGRFVDSLPELRQRRLQKIVFLKQAVADDLANELANILGLERPTGVGGRGGETVTKRLTRGDSFEFRDLRVRLVRVEEGDPTDRYDDQVELSVITGTQSNTVNLRELETIFLDNYEITAERVQPTGGQGQTTGGGGGGGAGGGQGGRRGEGSATIVIRYIEPIEAGTTVSPAQQQVPSAPSTQPPSADTGLSINPFGPLNALIIRYDSPAQLEDAMELIEQLDQPTKQVEVETKFVQVNETRAKEFSADFNLQNIMNDREFNTDFWRFNSRFAQTSDEIRDLASVPNVSPLSANLVKGTTILDLVLGTGVPGLSFQLRLLEAEGILNIVNGPKVTMLNGVTGIFQIDRAGPAVVGGAGAAGAAGGLFFSQFTQAAGGGAQDTLENEGGGFLQNRISAVVLEVTPEITSEKSILLEIIAEIIDLDNFLGEQIITTDPLIVPAGAAPPAPGTVAATQDSGFNSPGRSRRVTQGLVGRTRKLINTSARISDGGTIVLGGWTGERTLEATSGVPVLRNMPYLGKLLFSRNQRNSDRTTLLIFLTGNLID